MCFFDVRVPAARARRKATETKKQPHINRETERKKEHFLFVDITEKFHFTFSQCQQLKNFLIRWDVNFPERSLFSEIKDLNDAKSILDYMESSLKNHKLKWE